jgi:hypothetical protein
MPLAPPAALTDRTHRPTPVEEMVMLQETKQNQNTPILSLLREVDPTLNSQIFPSEQRMGRSSPCFDEWN